MTSERICLPIVMAKRRDYGVAVLDDMDFVVCEFYRLRRLLAVLPSTDN